MAETSSCRWIEMRPGDVVRGWQADFLPLGSVIRHVDNPDGPDLEKADDYIAETCWQVCRPEGKASPWGIAQDDLWEVRAVPAGATPQAPPATQPLPQRPDRTED